MGNFVNGLFGALVAMATLSSPLEAVAQDQAASPAQVPGEVSPTQTVSHNPDGETSSAISDKDSILVQTERNSNKALDALPTQTQAPHLPGTVNTTSRQIRAMSLFFVRCAEVPKSPAMFRSIVDNGPLDLEAQRALHEYIVRHQGCYQGVPDFSFPSPYFGECNADSDGICRTTYDRGELYEKAIEIYAAHYRLGQAQTLDPTVKARFDTREQQRNKRRSPYDRSYFMIAACMVQLTPKAGLDLLHSESGTPEETRARRLLIGRGTACVGGAKDVEVDPAQFRAYVAESVYSWIVAAKNKSSLIS